MKRPTKEDWFNVASICGEWIHGHGGFPGGSWPGIWEYYKKSCHWSLYQKALNQAAVVINPIQPFNVTCENEMFVALQIACEKAGLCR
jgi:hypothetical protein